MKRILLAGLLFVGFGCAASVVVNGEIVPPRKVGMLEVKSVVSVYDGDTFRAYIFGQSEQQRIRVRGVDTAEIKGKCDFEKRHAIKAREFTKAFLRKGKIYLTNLGTDRYKRTLADVQVNRQSLADALINAGLGRKWKGRRENWC